MFRAFSTRRYERLGGDGAGGIDDYHYYTVEDIKLRRVTSTPVKFLTSKSKKLGTDSNVITNPPAKPTAAKKAAAAGKVHPILSLLDPRRRKKATAKPEYARYLQYIKEGGVWDAKSNKPAIYYT